MADVVNPVKLAEGGYKADEDKPRMDLIPPDVLLDLGRLYSMGAAKYSPYNWAKGMKWGRPYAALLRHLFKWWMGEESDPDGQHHLDSVIWCAITLKYFVNHPEKYSSFDDRLK